MPDLDQLDPRLGAAFDHVARDVAGRSTPPGAQAAIRSARRRHAAFAGCAAVLVLILGGFAAGQFLDGEQRGDGIASDARPVPGPAPFTAESFGAATEGWLGPWQGTASELDEEGTCLGTYLSRSFGDWDSGGAVPTRVGGNELSTVRGDASVVVSFIEFDGASGAVGLHSALRDAATTCAPSAAGPVFAYNGRAGSGQGFAMASETRGQAEVTVAVQVDARLAVAMLLAETDAGAPSDDILERMADVLVAATQDDSSYQHEPSFSDSPAEGLDSIFPPPPAQLAQALEGWETDWEPEGRPQEIGSPPCLPAASWVDVDDGGGAGANRRVAGGGTYGTTGEIDYAGWQSREHAESAWAVIAESLETCQSTQWAITETTTGMGNEGLWATHDGGTVFAIHYNRDVAVLYLAGESDPPAEVADAVLFELSNKIMILGL